MRSREIALPAAALAFLAILLPACAAKKEVKLVLTRDEKILDPNIQDVRFEPGGQVDTWPGGRTISVLMTGDPELEATFDIPGRLKGHPMKEGEPGVYTGSFEVLHGEEGSLTVTGRLRHPPTGARGELRGREPLELVSVEPAKPETEEIDEMGSCDYFEKQLQSLIVYFEFDKYDLRADREDLLASRKEDLDSHPACTIYVHGHADEVGTEEYNLHLSMRRAVSVADFLQTLGIQSRLEKRFHGESQPAVTGGEPEARSRNRRVELHATVKD